MDKERKLNWFFCLNENRSGAFMDMAKAAVLSSIEYGINRHCLYDGNNTEFIAFLKQNNVNVILHETSFKSKILELVEPAAHPTYLGAFLRLDIPLIIDKLHLDIDYYLYTDCDIIFNRDPSEVFLNFFPSGIGASGENKQNQVDMFNSGVMWCNQKKMLETYQDFYNFVVDKKFKFTSIDQGALNEFYTHEKLPDEINWKPYWGINDEACIVHWHGPKPNHIKQWFNNALEIDNISQLKVYWQFLNAGTFNQHKYYLRKYNELLRTTY